MSFRSRARTSSRVQSVLFDKTKYTIPQAVRWLDLHNYRHYKVHTTGRFHRFRQYDPPMAPHREQYRTEKLGNGIEFVIGF